MAIAGFHCHPEEEESTQPCLLLLNQHEIITWLELHKSITTLVAKSHTHTHKKAKKLHYKHTNQTLALITVSECMFNSHMLWLLP